MKTYLVKKPAEEVYDPFEEFFRPMFCEEHADMKTDIRETDTSYTLDVEMPGFKKEDIQVCLNDGYLTVSAEKSDKDENGKEGGHRYLRRECSVSCTRSYYVGSDIEESSIKAKYEDGMLKLTVPKVQPKKLTAKSIAIE